jgi:glycerophosphoryl diester phosphodiesterase
MLLAALRKYDLEGEALVISFEPAWLAAMRRESRDLSLGVLAEEWKNDLPGVAERLGAEVLGLHTEIIGTTQVAAAQAKRLEVWAFTANDVGMVAACAAMGVTGIITDRPDLIRAR